MLIAAHKLNGVEYLGLYKYWYNEEDINKNEGLIVPKLGYKRLILDLIG